LVREKAQCAFCVRRQILIPGAKLENNLSGRRATAGPASVRVRWTQHDSSLDRGRLAELLANLSKQTSLDFRRQQRAVDVWYVEGE
jgi:hypothetical protein